MCSHHACCFIMEFHKLKQHDRVHTISSSLYTCIQCYNEMLTVMGKWETDAIFLAGVINTLVKEINSAINTTLQCRLDKIAMTKRGFSQSNTLIDIFTTHCFDVLSLMGELFLVHFWETWWIVNNFKWIDNFNGMVRWAKKTTAKKSLIDSDGVFFLPNVLTLIVLDPCLKL